MKKNDPTPASIPTSQTQIPADLLDLDPDNPSNSPISPQGTGELSVSGSTPDPESDDDVEKNAQDVGLYQTEGGDDEIVQPLNIAQQIEEAEKAHRDS